MDWQTWLLIWTDGHFFVKRHAKPSVFNKLSTKTLQKYATIFDITLSDLKNFKG